LLAHGRWFSPGTLTSSITKTGRIDIGEILLKAALKHQKSNQSTNRKIIERGKSDTPIPQIHNGYFS
jgi:hypothetical protein